MRKLLLMMMMLIACGMRASQSTPIDTASYTQQIDTLYIYKEVNVADPAQTRRLAITAGCVGLGIWLIKKRWSERLTTSIHRNLRKDYTRKFRIDDYTQYAPMVSVFALDACGVKAKHTFIDRLGVLTLAYIFMGTMTNTMKYSYKTLRPDKSTHNSFPSGHTATTFMGAELLYQEYKDSLPWIGYVGYGLAAGTGFLRMYNERHWLNDVVAGAGIGILSTKLAYWLYPKIFRKSDMAQKNRRMEVIAIPYYHNKSVGISMTMTF